MKIYKKKFKEITVSQLRDTSGDSHYLLPSLRGRERILHNIGDVHEIITLPTEIQAKLLALVEAYDAFKKSAKKLEWHNIIFTIPGQREPNKLFPPNFQEHKTEVTFDSPFKEELKKLGELCAEIFEYGNRNYGAGHTLISFLQSKDVPVKSVGDLGSAQQWKFNLITPNNTEIGNGLYRIHSVQGIPTILRSTSLGYKLYLSFIHHAGHACSSSNASDAARKVYAKLALSENSVFFLTNGTHLSMIISKTFMSDRDGRKLVLELISKFFRVTPGQWVVSIKANPKDLDLDLWNYILPYIKENLAADWEKSVEARDRDLEQQKLANLSAEQRRERETEAERKRNAEVVKKFDRAEKAFRATYPGNFEKVAVTSLTAYLNKISAALLEYSSKIHRFAGFNFTTSDNQDLYNKLVTYYTVGHVFKENDYLDFNRIDFSTFPLLNGRPLKIDVSRRVPLITSANENTIIRTSVADLEKLTKFVKQLTGKDVEVTKVLAR